MDKLNLLKRIYDELNDQKFGNLKELIDYINENIKEVPHIHKDSAFDYHMELNGKKYTFGWGNTYYIYMAIEDIVRATQVLNNIEIDGINNTPELIKVLLQH